MISKLIFLKLGGSLITDKTLVETIRPDVITRLASEIGRALDSSSDLSLLIGHGSGSFGHVAAAKHGTRNGVDNREQWSGFAEVSSAAARLNAMVRLALVDAGIPAITFQPSASAICSEGCIETMSVEQIYRSLEKGLVPIIYGDVAIDTSIGGTIISTEEILTFLTPYLNPTAILLAGETEGVLDESGEVIESIVDQDIDIVRRLIGGSRGTDVTGGMATKVEDMVALAAANPSLEIRILSGLVEGAVEQCLLNPSANIGTQIAAG
jgi:isopentenyl phosphate kinase